MGRIGVLPLWISDCPCVVHDEGPAYLLRDRGTQQIVAFVTYRECLRFLFALVNMLLQTVILLSAIVVFTQLGAGVVGVNCTI